MKTLLLTYGLGTAIFLHGVWLHLKRTASSSVAASKSLLTGPGGAVTVLCSHAPDEPTDVYRLSSPITLFWHTIMRMCVAWPSPYTILNYSIQVPDIETEPVLEAVVSGAAPGEPDRTLLCFPMELLDICMMRDPKLALLQTPYIDHACAYSAILELMSNAVRPPKVLLYQLNNVDVTPWMANLYCTEDVTVYDIALYFSRVHNIGSTPPIVPENSVLMCMLDDDELTVNEWKAIQKPFRRAQTSQST
jgi:hypothetical protein